MTETTDTIPQLSATDPAAHSGDVVAENVAALKALFPQVMTDGKVDFDVLRQLLGDTVEDGEERYGLNWKGKAKARAHALTPTLATLRPARQDSVDWNTTRNLMIEGDNLEVLKCLRKAYAGKVKLIYIDPPYNTGKDFVYPDNYTDSLANYLSLTGQRGADGAQLTSNKEGSGRFHTDWLNMMYPRLMLAKEMLHPEGVIFVSIDEAEHANLRAVASEVIGEDNFIGDLVWAAGKKNDSKLVSLSHEYFICFARNTQTLKALDTRWRQKKKGLDEIYAKYANLKKHHGDQFLAISGELKLWFKSLPDGHPAKQHSHYSAVDKRGIYFPDNISWPGGGGPKYPVEHPITKKPVKVPSRGWMTSDPAKMQKWIEEDRVHFGQDENSVPCIKAYLSDREYQTPYSVFYQDGRAATKRLRELMGEAVFDFPKDESVIQEIIEFASSDGDLVMDFFAGSGTTAHAVMAQNAEDAGKRRYVLVQLPEPLDPEKTEQKSAALFCDTASKPRNIAELTKERLRRVGAKIKAENPEADIDFGFRVYKLDTSNIRPWQPDAINLEASLLDAVSNIVHGRSEEDLLVELLLKTGIDLTTPEEVREIAGMTVHALGGGTLIVCLADIADADAEKLGHGIAEWQAELYPPGQTTLYFKDEGFASACAKANLAAILRQRMGDRIAKLASI